MTLLFLVNRRAALASCLQVAGATDTVLLIEDGVYAGVAPPTGSARVLALGPDVHARGLGERLDPGVGVIDDAGFVALTVSHNPVVTWQ